MLSLLSSKSFEYKKHLEELFQRKLLILEFWERNGNRDMQGNHTTKIYISFEVWGNEGIESVGSMMESTPLIDKNSGVLLVDQSKLGARNQMEWYSDNAEHYGKYPEPSILALGMASLRIIQFIGLEFYHLLR